MTVPLTELEYPIPRFPGTDQTLPVGIDRPQTGLRHPLPFSIPHLDGPATGVPSDIIVFYKSDAGGGESPAWSSQVYRFDPTTRTMRRIV